MTESNINPDICPLCQQQNRCANLNAENTKESCWCRDPSIHFPKALLDRVPENKKDKACICQQCMQTFLKEIVDENTNIGVKKYTPE